MCTTQPVPFAHYKTFGSMKEEEEMLILNASNEKLRKILKVKFYTTADNFKTYYGSSSNKRFCCCRVRHRRRNCLIN